MIHICNWQKNYSATYLGLVPDFEERPGCVFSPNILDVDLCQYLHEYVNMSICQSSIHFFHQTCPKSLHAFFVKSPVPHKLTSEILGLKTHSDLSSKIGTKPR